MPVPGVEISNSPSAVAAVDLRGRVLVQRSTSGVQALAALPAGARPVFAGCLAIATATARALEATGVEEVTLVATGEDRGHPEDRACALYLEGLLQGRPADLDALLAPLYESDRYRVVAAGDWPGFPPADLTLALAPDRFDFAIPIGRDSAGRLRATRS
jgi:2-phosphosulfolactate phosphatase